MLEKENNLIEDLDEISSILKPVKNETTSQNQGKEKKKKVVYTVINKQNSGMKPISKNATFEQKEIPPTKTTRKIKPKEELSISKENESQNSKKKSKKPKKTLKVIPLGGLEKIGMNMTAFECNDTIIVVDCGIAFPDDAIHPGVEAIIPNIQYLKDNIQKVKGFVVTHGHEDHIGAFPYILPQLNVPIYGTELTIGLINKKLIDTNLIDISESHVVNFGDEIDFGDIQVEFIKTNHSIVDAAALAIKTKVGTLIHTGDFKIDYTPIYGDIIDLPRFATLGDKGVLALLCDSTNAERLGFTPSEKKVAKTFDDVFYEYRHNRIIVATFATNVDRVQQIINSAYKYNRKVLLDGRSMVNIIDIAAELKKINLPKDILIEETDLGNYSDEQICIIATGSQGENMAALSRMANNTHNKISITNNDTVVFSSSPIPGNEKAIANIINNLERLGANVVTQNTHVSGHACQEEIKLIYSLVKPMYAVPLHGEFKHRIAGGKIAKELGMDDDHILIINSGDILEFDTKGNYYIDDKVEVGEVLIDNYSKIVVEDVVIRDRKKLANSGIINVIYCVEMDGGKSMYLNNAKIMSRGFVKVSNSFELLDEIKEKSIDVIMKYANKNGIIPSNVSISNIQDKISDFVFEKTRKRPIIVVTLLPIEKW